MTIELVSRNSNTGFLGSPDVSVPENAANPILCVRLSAGVTLARNVEVTLTTGANGTAQGKVCLFLCPVFKLGRGKDDIIIEDAVSTQGWSQLF